MIVPDLDLLIYAYIDDGGNEFHREARTWW